jgi:hypothetical protein
VGRLRSTARGCELTSGKIGELVLCNLQLLLELGDHHGVSSCFPLKAFTQSDTVTGIHLGPLLSQPTGVLQLPSEGGYCLCCADWVHLFLCQGPWAGALFCLCSSCLLLQGHWRRCHGKALAAPYRATSAFRRSSDVGDTGSRFRCKTSGCSIERRSPCGAGRRQVGRQSRGRRKRHASAQVRNLQTDKTLEFT